MLEGTAKKEGKITIFQVRDDLISERVKSFMKRVDQMIGNGNRFIVLDLTHVEEVSLLALVAISSLSSGQQRGFAYPAAKRKATGFIPPSRVEAGEPLSR